MAIGEVAPVPASGSADVHCVDVGMFDEPETTAVYVIDADRPAVVDAGLGTRYEAILDALGSVGIAPDDLAVIALTHVHLDHAGGAGYLADACPDAEVYVHPVGAPHMLDPDALVQGTKRAVGDAWQHYADPIPLEEDRIVEIVGGDAIDLGDCVLEVYEAPGHAPHQVVFHDDAAGTCFVADAAGLCFPATGSIHPTSPPPNFDLEGCLADVELLRDLAPETLCYGHFGAFEAEDRLGEYAHVLTDWVETIESARDELGDDEAVIERIVERWTQSGQPPNSGEVRMNVAGVLNYLDRRD